MKFAGSTQYHQQIEWLHFERNWNEDKDKIAGYDWIFESTSIGVAANSQVSLQDATGTQLHVNLENLIANFIHKTFISYNNRLYSPVRSLRLFACRGNAGAENIYNGRRTNAAAEASYDSVRSLTL